MTDFPTIVPLSEAELDAVTGGQRVIGGAGGAGGRGGRGGDGNSFATLINEVGGNQNVGAQTVTSDIGTGGAGGVGGAGGAGGSAAIG